MPLTTRPFTVSLAIALLGAAGAVSAAPVPAGGSQDRNAQAEDQQEAPPPKARPRQQGPQPHRRAPRQDRRRDPDPLSDSIRKIERTTRGQVISAERVPYDGRAVSRIKVVDEHGRVRVFVDDPQAAASDPRTRRDDD